MNPKHDNIQGYETSLSKLVSGVNKVASVLSPTYGPAGSNIVIEESLRPFHRVANDGKLIVDSIFLADPVERMGKDILSEVCEKQEKEAGDGRKTTVILTASILNEGMKYKDKVQPLQLKRELDECLPIILKSIDDQKRSIEPKDIHTVATVASESPEIGKIIGEAYEKIGREGIIEIDPSSLPTTFYEVVDGVRIRAGWFGGYWQTEPDRCVVNKPKILVTRDKITDAKQILPVLKEMREKGENELVIYCEDIELPVASSLAKTTLMTLSGDLEQGKMPLKTLIIKAPTLWKEWYYEDLALMTGATLVDSRVGRTFALLKYEHLGTCDKLISTKEETRIIGIKDLSNHVENLLKKADDDNQFKLRASWLNTKVAVLKVGANSESELSWKIKKAKDACHASYYALKDGVVTGAGETLVNSSRNLKETSGSRILVEAMKVPFEKIKESMNGNLMPNHDIQDPAIVIKSAITNAISVAGIILTTKGAITIPQEIKEMAMKMQARLPQ